ncbi:MAG: FtsW/RodA/SpoVE family cell cycle protein, partial [Ferruginibacter sp.]
MIHRNIERIFLLIISVVFGFLFYQLFTVLKKDFTEVPRRIGEGTMMNINDSNPGLRINTLLTKGFYFKDNRDIELISSVIEKEYAIHPGLTDNTGELNKSKYNINADDAYSRGGESFKKRVKVSRALLGFSENDTLLFEQERSNPMKLPAVNDIAMGPYKITGSVKNNEQAVAAVLVRLQMIIPHDSISIADIVESENKIIDFKNGVRKIFVIDSVGNRQLESLVVYARTNGRGDFSFNGLPADRAFEVIPLQPGYQFGRSKGVEKLASDASLSFSQSPHTIKLFSTFDFNTFKKEKSFIVRTPKEAIEWFWIIAIGFPVAFWLLHILLSLRFREADQFILPLLMLLTGFSLITLLSLQDPLRDRFFAKSTLIYFCGGFIVMVILLLFNLRRFTADSWLYRLFVFKNNRLAANGWPWALAATGLLTLTILFGTGPEGSGVKVNLLGFQPSEIVKFLVIIFLAGFFAMNEKFISEYASWKKRFSFFFFALIAIGITILLFLILGDLGPAMVCCFTFIILFSFSRGDFKEMTAAVILYILSIW